VITGATRFAALIGDPVRHSLSPVIHNAAFRELGLDWAFGAFEVPAGRATDAVAALRALNLGGMSVTMPHKEAVIPALDRVSATAARLRSVNTIAWHGLDLVGDSTDGIGFIDALRNDEGFDVAGRRAAVLGAGGAARAIVLALADAGADDVAILNRTRDNGEAAAALAPDRARFVQFVKEIGLAKEIEDADLVVNATSIGMAGTVAASELPIDPSWLRPGQLVVDIVYHPLRTPFLEAAKERGCVPVTGLGMLIHQAAHAFRMWTAEEPPLEVMSAAAMAILAGR
jgi:shikimate dehydrogenase